MRGLEHIRTVVAILLLSVALPMTLVVPFHHHEAATQEEFSCDLCAHHQPHPAHLTSSAHPDNCLICQFLGLSYLPVVEAQTPAASSDGSAFKMALIKEAPSVILTLLFTRAPPLFFC